jgi:hydrogenase maturation protease
MTSPTVVIGLGSPIMGDDGVGLTALARLREGWLVEGVEWIDGGTWGMSLLPAIEDAERLVLLDAIAAFQPPGTVVVLERESLPVYLERKLSPHQIDLRDVLAVATLRGTLPAETVAIGVQPHVVELGTTLSPAVERAVGPLVAAVIARLESWGHHCTPVMAGASCTK